MNTAPSTSDPQQLNWFSVSIDELESQPNLPCGDLIRGNRAGYANICVPLYEASTKGDWIAAEAIFQRSPEVVRFAITPTFETPLHVAAFAINDPTTAVEFVTRLVNLMNKEDLELQDVSFNTAFSLAAVAGNVEAAKIMLEKNKALIDIPGRQHMMRLHQASQPMVPLYQADNEDMMPLHQAVLYEREDMVRYLFQMPNIISSEYWTNDKRGWLLERCVHADYFDIAVKIIKDYPEVTSNDSILTNLLQLLAEKTYAFDEKKPHIILGIFKSICHVKLGQVERQNDAIYLLKMIAKVLSHMSTRKITQLTRGLPLVIHEGEYRKIIYPNRVLFVALKLSNMRFIVEVIRECRDLVHQVDDDGRSIFHIAAIHRYTEVFNLLHEIGSIKDKITAFEDVEGNNMLHLVAKCNTTEQNEPGGVIQMNRELLWYKEVEQMIPHSLRKKRNKKGDTPYDIFRREHVSLVPELGKWMKDTAEQCLVVATLITTMVFAAAFTLPGGYDQNTGLPLFSHKKSLIVFVVADAISLVFSSTSVLVFLSMITSRYTEHDIMITLPKKLGLGFATLFLSVVTMMVAFSASFSVLYIRNLNWIPKMVIGLSTVPVLIFALLHYHFIGDVSYSAYKSRYFFKRSL